MTVYTLDRNFNKMKVISNFSYLKLNFNSDSLNTVELKIQVIDCLDFIHKKSTYILIEDNCFSDVVFIVLDVKVETDEDSVEVTVKGVSLDFILEKRILYKQQTYKGTPFEIIQNVIEYNLGINSGERKLPITVAEKGQTSDNIVQKQGTGTSIRTFCEKLLHLNNMTYRFSYPYTKNLKNTTIIDYSQIQMVLSVNRDLTAESIENEPVIFSKARGNLYRSDYNYELEDYSNIAYVAGQGEGEDRIWEKVAVEEKIGFERWEVYVDAKDIEQKADSDYSSLLITRGEEKLKEMTVKENYSATCTSNTYKYGKDYLEGDKVLIQDLDLGLELSARVTSVVISVFGSEYLEDIVFGEEKIIRRL